MIYGIFYEAKKRTLKREERERGKGHFRHAEWERKKPRVLLQADNFDGPKFQFQSMVIIWKIKFNIAYQLFHPFDLFFYVPLINSPTQVVFV